MSGEQPVGVAPTQIKVGSLDTVQVRGEGVLEKGQKAVSNEDLSPPFRKTSPREFSATEKGSPLFWSPQQNQKNKTNNSCHVSTGRYCAQATVTVHYLS